ncbi:MAG: hypothetical protein VX589_10270 [Myxococcota bacterium]|nr:hypothetical protein [Myxococcota bacterium]
MSTYIPIVFKVIVEELRQRGLIVPLAGDPRFLSDDHRAVEQEIDAYGQSMFRTLQMPHGLQGSWVGKLNAVSRFMANTDSMFWARVYGADLVMEIGELIFGRDLRLGLTQPAHRRYRLGVSGVRGSARRPVGDAVRRLFADGMSRPKGLQAASGQTICLREGGEDGQQRLFGQTGHRLTDETLMGALNQSSQTDAVFIDGLLSSGPQTQHRVLEYLDWDGLSSGPLSPGESWRTVHWVAGFRPAEIGGALSPIADAIFKRSCRDGLIELPRANVLLTDRDQWARLFDLFYDQAILEACGASSHSIHQPFVHLDNEAGEVSDAVLAEQQTYLHWANEAGQRDALKDIVFPLFANYEWSGDLWEFESLIRRIVRARNTAALDAASIRELALEFRRHQPFDRPHDARLSKWASRFEGALPTLPLTEHALPQVLSNIEVCYLTEAARVAAASRAPKPARIGDVAHLLGVPRQTASRKWQGYGLSANLLVDDQK